MTTAAGPAASPRAPAGSVVLHGHFYQPPREDPWLGTVPAEANASPDHDWNTRILRECYAPLAAARLFDAAARVRGLVNAYAYLSFDVGPTLHRWLDEAAPQVGEAIREGDRASARRLGFGNALAAPYHHVILPLASRRDKVTEVRWGIADFRRRFGRDPDGMWLPETAADEETLVVLAEEGIRFTILAPHQVDPPADHGHARRFDAGGGRSLALMLYDGPLSHAIAFGPLLADGSALAEALETHARALPAPALAAVATDGETFGHHHRFGDLALAAAIETLLASHQVRLDNFAAHLARHPATLPATLVSPSSWSCPHGVERWRTACGCRTAPETQQAWRLPLRSALTTLADTLHERFATEGAALLGDPWAARNRLGGDPPPEALPPRARVLLEMERDTLRMFTSCAWFFDDIGGLEPRIALRYAARAIALAGDPDRRLARALEEALRHAPSNDPVIGAGDQVWRDCVREVDLAHIAAAVMVLEHLDGACPRHMETFRCRRDGAVLHLVHAPSGWADAFTGSASPEFLAEGIMVQHGVTTTQVHYRNLPEAARRQVRDRLVPRLIPRVLAPEAQRLVQQGEATLGAATAAAVCRLVRTTDEVTFLHAALDLMVLTEEAVPDQAVVLFAARLAAESEDRRAAWAALAPRFGITLSVRTLPGPADA